MFANLLELCPTVHVQDRYMFYIHKTALTTEHMDPNTAIKKLRHMFDPSVKLLNIGLKKPNPIPSCMLDRTFGILDDLSKFSSPSAG